MTRHLLLTCAAAITFLAAPALAAITILSTSTPLVTVVTPVVKVEDAGTTNCVTTPGLNATSSSLGVVSTSGTTDYGQCLLLRNTGATLRVFKVRYLSGTNENRFSDVQVKSGGGVQHMKWSSGTLGTSETDSWQSISPGSTAAVHVRVRIGSGPASVINSEIMVARDGVPDVYALYPLTLTFSAT